MAGTRVSVLLVLIELTAFFCIIAASIFVSLELYIEIRCLEQDLSNVNCEFTNRNDTLISKDFAKVTQILEPVLSVIVVTHAVFYYALHYGRSRGMYTVFEWFSVFKNSWFMKRFVALLFVIFYYFYVYTAAESTKKRVAGRDRYLVLPFGVLTWFILLTVSNENGPLSWAARDQQRRLTKPLSFLLFLFAAVTNAAEFAIVTVYITKTIWTIFVDEEDEDLINIVDTLGMTITIALRFDFTNVFSDMATLSLKDKQYGGKWKLLRDRWDDWPNSDSSELNSRSSSFECLVPLDEQEKNPAYGSIGNMMA